MLAGAELQAAILQRRGQLRPAPRGDGGNENGASGRMISLGSENGTKLDEDCGNPSSVSGGGLQAVLRRGLERVQQHMSQPASASLARPSSRTPAISVDDDVTGGNLEFLRALARRKNQIGGQ